MSESAHHATRAGRSWRGFLLLRFVWAVVAFVLAALLIGAGIAQRTVFLGPTTVQSEMTVEEQLPYTLVDGAVLNRHAGAQTLLAQAEGPVFAAYARTGDMQAWLGDVSYNHIVLDADGAPVVEVVGPQAPVEAAPAEGEVPAEGEAPAEEAPVDTAPARTPVGSDLWLDEFTQEDRLITTLDLPDTMSVLIATDGAAPAPSTVQLSWPTENSTPWAGPLIVLGGLFMLLGIVLYVLGIRKIRRSRGPRRKAPPPLEATQPIQTIEAAPKRRALTTGRTAEKKSGPNPPKNGRARRVLLVIPAAAVATTLFAGCSPEAWPQLGPTPTPTPTPTVLDDEAAQAPAVTERQAERILARVAQTVAEADEAANADLAATRLGGVALEERKTNYTIRGTVADHAPLPAIPTTVASFVLPQAYEGWPRSVLMVVGDESAIVDEEGETSAPDESEAPTPTDAPAEGVTVAPSDAPAEGAPVEEAPAEGAPAEGEPATDAAATPAPEPVAPAAPRLVLLTQSDPWSEYKLVYSASITASTTLPDVAGATVGAFQIPPDSTFLALPPAEIAAAYADLMNKGDASVFAPLFSPDDPFRTLIAANRQAQTDEFNQTGAETGTISFESAPGAFESFALATLESGAIVAVNVTETETVRSTNEDAVIKLDKNPAVAALTGVTSTDTGVQTTQSDQLFFYVPNQASGDQIRLIGFDTNILSAGVIE